MTNEPGSADFATATATIQAQADFLRAQQAQFTATLAALDTLLDVRHADEAAMALGRPL